MKSNLHNKNKQFIHIENLFRELSMKNVIGYEELSEEEKDLFDVTYKKHLSSLGEKERVYYAERNVHKVENNIQIVKVHFKNGESYIYIDGCKWIKLSNN